MQDLLQASEEVKIIFFEKNQALKFIKNMALYGVNSGKKSNLEFAVLKPKIYVYNLEILLKMRRSPSGD
jgi:hypothetical protein